MVEAAERRKTRMETRRRDILEAAAVEFASVGYERATLEGIGTRLGLSKAGLYHYVEGKEQLLVDLAQHAIEEIDREASSLTGEKATAGEQLAAFVAAHIRVAVETQAGRVLAGNLERLLTGVDSASVRNRHQQRLEAILQAGIDTGEFRPLAVAPLLQMLFAAVNAIPRWFDPNGPLTVTELIDQTVGIILEGITEKGRK